MFIDCRLPFRIAAYPVCNWTFKVLAYVGHRTCEVDHHYKGVYLIPDLKTIIDRCCVINNEANYHGHECKKKSGQLIFRDIDKS